VSLAKRLLDEECDVVGAASLQVCLLPDEIVKLNLHIKGTFGSFGQPLSDQGL
jgi:hypothetical protein